MARASGKQRFPSNTSRFDNLSSSLKDWLQKYLGEVILQFLSKEQKGKELLAYEVHALV